MTAQTTAETADLYVQNGELHLSEAIIPHQLMCILHMSFTLQGGFLLFYFGPFRFILLPN